jgi:hypothetical protein
VTADRAPIFDDLERTEATPSEHGEPIFDFLNRVAGTYIHDPDRWHSANALYGPEAIQIGETSDGETVRRVVRQRDGYFGVPDNWQHQNVSAVLLINS